MINLPYLSGMMTSLAIDRPRTNITAMETTAARRLRARKMLLPPDCLAVFTGMLAGLAMNSSSRGRLYEQYSRRRLVPTKKLQGLAMLYNVLRDRLLYTSSAERRCAF